MSILTSNGMKINFFTKKNNFKKKDFTIYPNLYWKSILFCAFVIILFSFIFSYRLFVQTNQEFSLPSMDNGGELPFINKDSFEKVLSYFSEKEKKLIEILNSPAPVVDPSL